MIDYLLKFDGSEQATSWSEAHGLDDTNSMPCRVYIDCGTTTITDPEAGTTWSEPIKEFLPFAYIWAVMDAERPDFAADPACVLVADRNAFERGEAFVLQSAFPAEELSQYFVEPVMAGPRYPFGSIPAE